MKIFLRKDTIVEIEFGDYVYETVLAVTDFNMCFDDKYIPFEYRKYNDCIIVVEPKQMWAIKINIKDVIFI